MRSNRCISHLSYLIVQKKKKNEKAKFNNTFVGMYSTRYVSLYFTFSFISLESAPPDSNCLSLCWRSVDSASVGILASSPFSFKSRLFVTTRPAILSSRAFVQGCVMIGYGIGQSLDLNPVFPKWLDPDPVLVVRHDLKIPPTRTFFQYLFTSFIIK